MADRSPDTTTSRGPASRTDVDIATGVLVGLQGGSVSAAVDDLFSTARDNRLSLFELARAVITLAEGGDRGDTETRRVALARWGAHLAPRSASEDSVSA